MENIYQYPVYFECHSLRNDEIRKIRNYFSIYRKSSGGDCGPLRSVDDGVYSVAFIDRNAQQRVLQISKHVVELANGSLVLTVRDRVEPHTSLPITTSMPSRCNKDVTAAQSPQSVPASTPPPSGEEYELQRDAFLLRYLHECSKALTKLQEELTTVFCSAQIYPEEEKVLVRSLAADEGRNWKSEVDKIFDGYQCHYEVDPHKVKALLQSCSSNQTTDEVKVYSEGGMAVVVGECSQVDARLMDVEDSTVKLRWSRLREKQTSTHQLGEAKLHLLWKEIKQKLEQDFPGVNVTQGDAGQLVLEGYAEEVLGALSWVSEKENLVLERTISDHSPHLLSFLRKAYGGCIVLGDILGLSDDVAIELQDKQLRFFTLSADKLDHTQKTLRSKFREIKIDVSYCSTVPSELQEMLKSMTNEINQGQCKVQVVFSGSTVYLLGHTKEVEELSEIVTQFILDQCSEKNTFHLQEYNKSTQELALLSLSEGNQLVASYNLCPPSAQGIIQTKKQIDTCVQEGFTKDIQKPDQVSTTKRIILLGKTGVGKSSLANTIFKEELFSTNHTPNSGTKVCQAETRLVNERNITLIDTPGLFDSEMSEEELKPEILSCITECAPGPHAFLIVLKVEMFTEQEKAVIDKICEYFSEDALKYAVIVFTHGNQLPKKMKIEDFVSQNKNLSDLVEKCGGRCHVFDNMYWKNNQQNNYRSNQFQVEELLSTTDKMVMENNGGYYTNMMLQVVEEEIKKEEEHIKQLSGNMQLEEIRKQAKTTVSNRLLVQLTGTATGALLGALFGFALMVGIDVTAVNSSMGLIKLMKSSGQIVKKAAAFNVTEQVTTAAIAARGGVMGGLIGQEAAEGAETVQEAAKRAYKAVIERRQTFKYN